MMSAAGLGYISQQPRKEEKMEIKQKIEKCLLNGRAGLTIEMVRWEAKKTLKDGKKRGLTSRPSYSSFLVNYGASFRVRPHEEGVKITFYLAKARHRYFKTWWRWRGSVTMSKKEVNKLPYYDFSNRATSGGAFEKGYFA